MTYEQKKDAIQSYCDARTTNGDCEGCAIENLCKEHNRIFDESIIDQAYTLAWGIVPVSDDDPVNHPSHYCKGGIECLDAIEASMGSDEYLGFLKGQIMKYVWRYDLKGKPIEDLKKARFYLDRMIKKMEDAGHD